MATWLKRLVLSAAVVGLLPSVSAAQFDISYELTSGDVQITSFGPYGPQMGTFRLKLLSNPGQPVIDVWCLDFLNTINMNPRRANFTALTAGATDFNQRTRWGTAKLDAYKQAAFLTTLLAPAAALTGNATTVKAIHCTIWQLFAASGLVDCSGVNTAPYQQMATDAAAANYYGMNFRYWFVISPLELASYSGTNRPEAHWQELITHQTPEPASMVLVATGLIALGATSYRNRRKKL